MPIAQIFQEKRRFCSKTRSPVGSPTHAVVSSSVRSADNHGDFRNFGARHSRHHFGSIFRNSSCFSLPSHHETCKMLSVTKTAPTGTAFVSFHAESSKSALACDILQKEKRYSSLTAQLNEMCALHEREKETPTSRLAVKNCCAQNWFEAPRKDQSQRTTSHTLTADSEKSTPLFPMIPTG